MVTCAVRVATWGSASATACEGGGARVGRVASVGQRVLILGVGTRSGTAPPGLWEEWNCATKAQHPWAEAEAE